MNEKNARKYVMCRKINTVLIYLSMLTRNLYSSITFNRLWRCQHNLLLRLNNIYTFTMTLFPFVIFLRFYLTNEWTQNCDNQGDFLSYLKISNFFSSNMNLYWLGQKLAVLHNSGIINLVLMLYLYIKYLKFRRKLMIFFKFK